MERLTNIGTNGEIWITDNDETRRFGRKESAYKKLADYEDLEEQGRLIKLPCKVEDTVYEFGINSQLKQSMFDRTVFLTKSEAEQKLKEMESD